MKIIEANKMIENIRFFTLKLSELLKKCLMEQYEQLCTEKNGRRWKTLISSSHKKGLPR